MGHQPTSPESVTIEPLGPDSTDSLFERALELTNVLLAEWDPATDPDTEGLFRGALTGSDTFEIRTLVATEAGEAVGIACVELHHMETNADKLELEIEVHPDHRRRGIGTALLGSVVELAEAEGRASIISANLDRDPAHGFWGAMGAAQGLVERESRLWLDHTDDGLMHEWVDRGQAGAAAYRLEHYRGITPGPLRSAVAHLTTMMRDAPLGGLEREEDVWTETEVVRFDELMIDRGRDRWTTVALGPNGEPAGLTSVGLQRGKPRFARQGNTVVDRSHRGRGIGRWLKADMWLRLRRDAPDVVAVDTDNATGNAPMLAINDAMGFRPLVEWGIWQADVATLREAVASRRRGVT